MRTNIILLILFISISSTAQTTEIREITPFTQLEVSGAANVQFLQSDTLSLKVTADKSEMSNVYTTVENGILTIRGRGSFLHSYKVYLSGPAPNQITASAASKITVLNILKCDSVFIVASGASNVTANIDCPNASVNVSGASMVNLEGKNNMLHSSVSGASTLKTYKLNTETVNITTSGASTAKVYASQKINANATGSSAIKFKGDPKDVSAEASNSSSIAKVVGDENNNMSSKRDSTTFNFKKKKFVIIDKHLDIDTHLSNDDQEFHNWAGFGIGVNGWTSGGSFILPKNQKYMELNYGKSLNFQLNPLEKDIHIYKNYVNLVVGLGFEWSQYEFRNRTKLNPDSSYTSGIIDSSNVFNYRKNRFKTTFVNVPVLLEFNTSKNPHKAFHIAFGVIGGYKLGSRTRQVLELKGEDIKLIRKDNYNLNPFRVNAHASIGYNNFTLYADYALTPLFESGRGPELFPFTFGVKLVSF